MKKIFSLVLLILTLLYVNYLKLNRELDNIELGGTFLHKEENVNYIYDDPIVLTNNFSTHYFKKLTTNFGENIKGSCGYVAMGMLLSYYDTYWSDNIISENFDIIEDIYGGNFYNSFSSPGIKRENYGNNIYSNVEYYNKVVTDSNDHFHSYLIRLGNEEFDLYHNLIPDDPCMLLINEFETLLEQYLYNVKGYNSNMISIEKCNNSDNVRNFIIDRVILGIPVVGYISANFLTKHYVIFYDYNQLNDELYAHFGWSGGNNFSHIRFSSSTNYSNIEAALALDVNIPHVCGNNYRNYEDYERYCSCYFKIHPEHEHTYIQYTNFNKLKHSGLCRCGDSFLLPHIVREGTSICVLCGGQVETGFATFGGRMLVNPVKKTILTNSYILENDIIVISNTDYSNMSNNQMKDFLKEGQI